MSQQHTPGPWTITRYEDEPETYVYFQAPDWLNFARAAIRRVDDAEDSPTGIANARLIAAAPDMLEALESAADELERIADIHGYGRASILRAARAAIAKATGGQP
jgi:hypothetical protein